MKKIILILSLLMILTGCQKVSDINSSENTESNLESEESSSEDISSESNNSNDKVVINSLNGNSENIELEVPLNPTNVAVLDLASLDTIDYLEKGDSIKGLSKSSILNGKEKYYENEDIVNLGSVKEVDYEELAALQPEIIFAGGRLKSQYDKLSEIAPVVLLSVDTSNGSAFESIKSNISQIAKIYGLEDTINNKFEDYKERINELKTKSKGKTALISIVTNGEISLLSNEGRGAFISLDGGFDNLAADSAENSHGDSASFETVLQLNPDYLFVLDRDQAIAAEGASLAKDVLDNEIIAQTKAYKSNNIYYLNPSVWYLAEGGLGALDIMIQDVEQAFK